MMFQGEDFKLVPIGDDKYDLLLKRGKEFYVAKHDISMNHAVKDIVYRRLSSKYNIMNIKDASKHFAEEYVNGMVELKKRFMKEEDEANKKNISNESI